MMYWSLQKGEGIEITKEQAEAVFKSFGEDVALSDDDLDKVSGGFCDVPPGGC